MFITQVVAAVHEFMVNAHTHIFYSDQLLASRRRGCLNFELDKSGLVTFQLPSHFVLVALTSLRVTSLVRIVRIARGKSWEESSSKLNLKGVYLVTQRG